MAIKTGARRAEQHRQCEIEIDKRSPRELDSPKAV
jgi:hypothetical protein